MMRVRVGRVLLLLQRKTLKRRSNEAINLHRLHLSVYRLHRHKTPSKHNPPFGVPEFRGENLLDFFVGDGRAWAIAVRMGFI